MSASVAIRTRGSKMRVLILSAILACVAAAPSGLLAPVAVPVAYSIVGPTISPGDIQAAAIDAQVKAQDIAIAAVDKARELSDLAVKNYNEKAISINDQVKEKVVEQFWSVEDQKWQALDALQTAQAQIDGSVASNADALSKSAVITPYAAVAPGVLPVAPVLPISLAPNVLPVAPVAPVFAPGITAPAVKAVEEPKEMKVEAAVKTAETEEAKESVAVEAKPEEKPVEVKNLDAKALESIIAVDHFRYPIVPQVLKYAAVPYGVQTLGLAHQPILAPTIYKTVW